MAYPNTPRQRALQAGERFYHGCPCKHCSETLRYANTTKCVACVALESKGRAEQRRKGPSPDYRVNDPRCYRNQVFVLGSPSRVLTNINK